HSVSSSDGHRRDLHSFPTRRSSDLILVSKEHPFPQIKKHRGAKKEKGDYYGPFASAGAVNRTLNQLQKVFLLRNCSDAMFASRTDRKSTRLNSSHVKISYAVFCLKK